MEGLAVTEGPEQQTELSGLGLQEGQDIALDWGGQVVGISFRKFARLGLGQGHGSSSRKGQLQYDLGCEIRAMFHR